MSRTLTITVEPDWKKDLRRFGALAQKGMDTGQYQGEYLNFATPDTFFAHLSAHRWRILTCLLDAGILGVRELARRMKRDVKRVHEDAQALVQLGLLEKTEQGALHCPYVRINIDMALLPRAPDRNSDSLDARAVHPAVAQARNTARHPARHTAALMRQG